MIIEEHTRRRFLAALGIGGAAAALAPGTALAAPAPPPPDDTGTFGAPLPGVEGTAAMGAEAYPVRLPGTRYSLFSGGQFIPITETATYGKGPWLACSTDDSFVLPLNMLPNGAVVSELAFRFLKSSEYPGNLVGSLVKIPPYDSAASFVSVGEGNSTKFPQLNTLQELDVALTGTVADRTIDHQTADHWLVAELGNNILFDVRVGWLPPAAPLGFYPLAPKRVYDSRRSNGLYNPMLTGWMFASTSRVVSVKDGYVNDTDTLDAPDIIPVGAKAIAYNLTIVGTTGAGYLSVGPGDATTAGGSSINWSGPDQVLANGLTVTLDAWRQIKVFAGPGGGTHFLIDVLGYYA